MWPVTDKKELKKLIVWEGTVCHSGKNTVASYNVLLVVRCLEMNAESFSAFLFSLDPTSMVPHVKGVSSYPI